MEYRHEVTGATPKSNTTWSAYFTNWTLTALSLKEELILLEVWRPIIKKFNYLDIIGFQWKWRRNRRTRTLLTKLPNTLCHCYRNPHLSNPWRIPKPDTMEKTGFPRSLGKRNINWEQFKHRVFFPIPDLTEKEECFPKNWLSHYQSSYDNASVRISARKSWQRPVLPLG